MDVSVSRQRQGGLDIIKALALYFVVLYHLTFRNSPDIFSGRGMDYIEYICAALLSVCVPLLFTVSGALALRRPVDLRRSLRRSLRVLLLGVVWAVISLGIVLLLRQERMSSRTFFSTVYSLQVGYIQHLWYMPAFFVLCLLTPVMQALRQSDRKVYRYGLAILMIYTFGNSLLSDLEYLVRWLTGHLNYTGNREYFWYTDFFGAHYWYAFVYYALGAFLLERRERFRRWRKAAMAAIPVSLACLTVFALARSHVRGEVFDPVFNNYGDVFTLVMTVSVTLLLMEVQPGPGLGGWLKSLSSCSLGVYLVHWLVIEAILDYLPALTAGNRIAPLTALAVLALSWGISAGCRKLPLVRQLFTVSPAEWNG